MRGATVKTNAMILTLAAALAASGAFADDKAAPNYHPVATDKAATTDNPAGPGGETANLEAQLEAARKRLEEAAHQVAELSAQMGKPLMQKFMAFGEEPGRAIIGVQLDASSGKDGAHVREVSPGGPAAEAGMHAGDVIVSVNGTDVKGEDPARQVVKIMHEVKPDTKVKVRVLRDGKPRDLTIVARPGPGFGYMGFERGPPDISLQDFKFEGMPGMPMLKAPVMIRGPLADIELETLTPKLGHYFGTDKGVLVVRASAEGGLNLEDGDVILAIDGREPTSGSHATRILASYQPGEKITLRIMREHKTMNVETTVPDKPTTRRKVVILPDREEHSPQNVVFLSNGEGAT
jgi:S1-C subfamily serine protease